MNYYCPLYDYKSIANRHFQNAKYNANEVEKRDTKKGGKVRSFELFALRVFSVPAALVF